MARRIFTPMVMVLLAARLGLADPAPGPGPTGPGHARVDALEDADEVLQVLAEGGVPPTRDDLARILGDPRGEGPDRPAGTFLSSLGGSVQTRAGQVFAEGMDRQVRATLTSPWCRARGRVRSHRHGWREITFTGELTAGPLEIRGGNLGLAHGFGLLAGPPGRSSTLTADGRLGPRADRLVSWAGTPDARTLAGLGGRIRLGPLALRVLAGQRGPAATPGTERIYLGQLVGGWSRGRVSVAMVGDAFSRGGSLVVRLTRESVQADVEAMVRQDNRGGPWSGATVIRLGWSPARGTGIEGIWGLADLGGPPPLASRPAVLPGWTGTGHALRGTVRLGRGYLKGLVQQGRHLDRSGVRQRKERTLLDLQAGRDLGSGVEMTVRYRRTDRRRLGWRERFPWQPPRLVAREDHAVLSVGVGAEGRGLRGRLLLRSYSRSSATITGRRSLMSLAVGHKPGPGVRIKGTWVAAWGDPVDLVGAVSPLAGMVLPRHWGQWRSEILLGGTWTRGPVRFQAGWSGRRPAAMPPAGLAHTLWAEAEIRW